MYVYIYTYTYVCVHPSSNSQIACHNSHRLTNTSLSWLENRVPQDPPLTHSFPLNGLLWTVSVSAQEQQRPCDSNSSSRSRPTHWRDMPKVRIWTRNQGESCEACCVILWTRNQTLLLQLCKHKYGNCNFPCLSFVCNGTIKWMLWDGLEVTFFFARGFLWASQSEDEGPCTITTTCPQSSVWAYFPRA